MKKENVATTVVPCKNDKRIVIELDVLFAAFKRDSETSEQPILPKSTN